MELALVLAAVLIPLVLILYHFGFTVTRAGAFVLNASCSLPTRWEGRLSGATGYMRRNFLVFQRCSKLCLECESASGSMEFEVKAPDGSVLSPASGVYGRDARILFDVGPYKRCAVMLNMAQFSGHYRITLQQSQTVV